MVSKGVKAFSREEVVFIKENLIRGVTVADLARYYGVSGETISKIRRGVTYVGVRVPGEEALRAGNAMGAPRNPTGEWNAPVRERTDEEVAAYGDAALEELKKLGVVKPPEEDLSKAFGLDLDGPEIQ